MRRVIYFVRVGEFLKVGVTTNLARRLVELRSPAHRRKQRTPEGLRHGSVPMTLIGTVPAAPGRESACFRVLRKHRIVGEWFALTPESLGLVARILRAPDEPSLVLMLEPPEVVAS